MATITVTIQEFEGNFVCGNTEDQISAINLQQSICNYKSQVVKALFDFNPEIEIEWDLRKGEGDPKHTVTPGDGYELFAEEENGLLFTIDAVREKAFSLGEFWATA